MIPAMAAEKTETVPSDELERWAREGRPGAARRLGHRLCVQVDATILISPDTTPDGERWLRRALDLDPHDGLAAVLLGGLLHRQCDTAMRDGVWLEEPGDDDEQAALWLAALRERWTEAEQWYQHALALEPGDGAAAAGLAHMLTDRLTALEDYRSEFIGDDVFGADDMLDARILFEDAGEDAEAAVRDEAAHWARRALLAFALGDAAGGAARQWLRVVELAPQDYWSAVQAVTSPWRASIWSRMERACREAAEAGDPEAVYSLALILDATGREAEADDWLARPTARPVPAELAAEGGDGPEHVSLPALRLAKRLSGQAARRWATRAVLLAKDRMLYRCMDRYTKLLDGPDDGADVRAELERWLAAGHSEAGFALMLLHRVQGRPEEAERCRVRAVELRGE